MSVRIRLNHGFAKRERERTLLSLRPPVSKDCVHEQTAETSWYQLNRCSCEQSVLTLSSIIQPIMIGSVWFARQLTYLFACNVSCTDQLTDRPSHLTYGVNQRNRMHENYCIICFVCHPHCILHFAKCKTGKLLKRVLSVIPRELARMLGTNNFAVIVLAIDFCPLTGEARLIDSFPYYIRAMSKAKVDH